MPLHLSTNKGLSLKEWGISAQVQLSAFSGNPPLQTGEITSSKRHPTGREILIYSLLPDSGRSQRVSLRTSVAKLLILVVSKFPSWPQTKLAVTGTFLEKSNNKNIILLALLFRQKKYKFQGY